jgi:hypothetical protein
MKDERRKMEDGGWKISFAVIIIIIAIKSFVP